MISKGLDPEDAVEGADPPASDDARPFHLVHTGSFSASHPWRSPRGLLEAIRLLIEADPAWSRRLKVTLVGHLTSAEARDAAKLTSSGVVQTVEEADRAESLRFQQQGDLLLLVDHPRPWPASNLPNKLFEYLALKRPILALCTAGMVADTIAELKAGVCVAPDDPSAIARAVERLYQAFASGTLKHHACTAPLNRFHRRFLTQQLAQRFDEVLARYQRAPGP